MAKSLSDFNDLHGAAGLDEVRRQLLAALDTEPVALTGPPPVSIENELPATETLRVPDDYGETRSDLSGPEQFEIPPDRGFEWVCELKKTMTGSYQANIFNAQLILQHDTCWRGVLGYCDFSYRIVKRALPPWDGAALGEWTDADTARLRIWFCKKYSMTPKTADADDAVMVAAQAQRFHPVREYLESLVWDGTERLDSWLQTYLGATKLAQTPKEAGENIDVEKYVTLVGRMWMISAVVRVMRPPVKVDSVLILEGLQGLGKSTALKILGGDWFSDTHFALGDKDGYQQMQGLWICELAELDSFNKAESTRAKQFFGSEKDRYRPSYGRRAQDFSRQCVFAGSTNQNNYLKDPTGNRRYWPVLCTKLDTALLARDRDQLWAEAVHYFREGLRWWVDDSEKYLFEGQQEERFEADAWEDLIVEWLNDVLNRGKDFTTADIMKGALKLEPGQIKPPEQTRVGRIMARLGWTTQRLGGRYAARKRVYRPPDGWNYS